MSASTLKKKGKHVLERSLSEKGLLVRDRASQTLPYCLLYFIVTTSQPQSLKVIPFHLAVLFFLSRSLMSEEVPSVLSISLMCSWMTGPASLYTKFIPLMSQKAWKIRDLDTSFVARLSANLKLKETKASRLRTLFFKMKSRISSSFVCEIWYCHANNPDLWQCVIWVSWLNSIPGFYDNFFNSPAITL